MQVQRILLIILACFITSIGVIILKHSFILTGGTAGLSLSLLYLFNLPFSVLFFLINIPFYIFSIFKMGWRFTLSTVFAVSLLSLMTSLDSLLPAFIIPYWLGAILGGIIIGFGLSLLFMHGASLGGVNIVALYLQQRFEIDPGKTNFTFDALVLLTGIYAVGFIQGLFSMISIAIICKVIGHYKNEIAIRNNQSSSSTEVPQPGPAQGSQFQVAR